MKKYLLISFLMFLGFFNARSQVSDGTYGFLNTTHSARVAALGGTLVPIQDSDIQLTVFNPALINTEMNNAIALSYVDYYSDINFASIQYGRTFDKIGSFVATVQFQNYGRFYYADESGYTDGTVFSPSDYCFTLGWGRQLNPKLSIGANLRFGGLQYEQYSTFAILVDVAANYDLGNDLMLSAAVRNVGDELYNNLDGVKSTLPFRMQLGMSKKLEHLPFLFMIVYDNLQKLIPITQDQCKKYVQLGVLPYNVIYKLVRKQPLQVQLPCYILIIKHQLFWFKERLKRIRYWFVKIRTRKGKRIFRALGIDIINEEKK